MCKPLFAAAFLGAFPVLTPSAQELAWTDGVLGSKVEYALTATPGKFWMLGISTNPGPTPVGLIDPSDPRVLSLGLEFLSLWTTGVLDAAGEAIQVYPLPSSPSAVGIKIHAQFLTLFGTTTLVDEISNAVSLRMQLPGTSVSTVGARPTPGTLHTQTLLQDGRVLLFGGEDPSSAPDAPLGVRETFHPQTQAFAQEAPVEERAQHTATQLGDGRVLLVGGRGAAGALDLVQVYEPPIGEVLAAAPLPAPRSHHTATLLQDGRVLVVGGLAHDDPLDPVASYLSAHVGTLVYDPTADAWSVGPSLPKGLIGHQAALLPDGRVLITGGVELGSLFGFPTQSWTARCWLFDPGSATLSPAAPMPAGVARHAMLVPSGDDRPLVIGGERVEAFLLKVYVADVLRYDPLADDWTPMPPLNAPRGFHAAVEAAGKLVVVGGIGAFDSGQLVETPEPTAELAPLDASAWDRPIPLAAARPRPCATPFDGGVRILITGGPLEGETGPTAEILMP